MRRAPLHLGGRGGLGARARPSRSDRGAEAVLRIPRRRDEPLQPVPPGVDPRAADCAKRRPERPRHGYEQRPPHDADHALHWAGGLLLEGRSRCGASARDEHGRQQLHLPLRAALVHGAGSGRGGDHHRRHLRRQRAESLHRVLACGRHARALVGGRQACAGRGTPMCDAAPHGGGVPAAGDAAGEGRRADSRGALRGVAGGPRGHLERVGGPRRGA
mmetsp:Transcript_81808/g.210742  ORF Transcript_81808/g.210742 Transcript_81808/m.210742 type:complete len:217 (+) Transcript_81808:359-1009(+)